MRTFFYTMALVCLLSGCALSRQRGGHSNVRSGGLSATMKQSQNPKDPSAQTAQLEKTVEVELPAGSIVEHLNDAGKVVSRDIIAVPTVQRSVEKNTVTTKIGGAQKDIVGETAAKLKSMSMILWVGIVLFVFGLASVAYPPLKLIVGSVTTSVLCMIGGAGLMILPVLIVGHELLILCVTGGAVALWFFAHRHGGLRAEATTLKATLEKLTTK